MNDHTAAVHKEKPFNQKQEKQGKEEVSQAWHTRRRGASQGVSIPQLRQLEGERYNCWSLMEYGEVFDTINF